MNIVVCLHAPPPDPDGAGLGRDDAHALAQALALAAGGPAHASPRCSRAPSHESGPLQRALVAGATRAVRLGGEDYGSVDFHTLGQALAAGIKRIGADLVLTGARSDDEGLGAVPASTARHLGFPFIAGIEELAAARPAGRRGRGARRRPEAPPARRAAGGARDRRRPAAARRRARIAPANPSEVELLTLADPEATVVRRRTELLGKPEPASRGAEEVTSAAGSDRRAHAR